MKCLNPVTAWKCGFLFCKTDKVISPRLVFSRDEALRYHSAIGSILADNEVKLPCGHCTACLIQKRKDMSTRLCHEASVHETATFLTLTYNDDFVPTTDTQVLGDFDKVFSRGSHEGVAEVIPDSELPLKTLLPADVQRFMKRLRRHLDYVPKGCHIETLANGSQVVRHSDGHYVRDHASNLRYFAVGEYGTRTKRPHYHILIFGWTPTDAEFFSVRKKNVLSTSAQIQKLWTFGFSTVSSVSPQVCKYCARYVTKKFVSTAPLDKRIVPEFTLQSVRNGGMGSLWWMRFGEDAVRRGFVTVRSSPDNIIKCRVPPYYLSLCRRHKLPLWLEVREERLEFIRAHKGEPVDFDALRRSCDVSIHNEKKLSQDDLF